MKKKEPKVTAIFESEEPVSGAKHTIEKPVSKSASVNVTGMSLFHLAQGPGRDGMTYNFSTDLIPEGYRLKSLTFRRE